MRGQLKSFLSKLNFALGRNPILDVPKNPDKYIPKPYKAVVTITADFELAWAWRYAKDAGSQIDFALKKAKTERINVPKILDLCERFNLPITWATVGHLFLSNCVKERGLPHREVPRLGNFENDNWKFSGSDWFEFDPCSDYKSAPEWYCPDLIDQILSSKVKHEIGCHTFSHIDCRDEVCPSEVFLAEVNKCKELAAERGIELRSFVHPGHTIGNLNNLAWAGFKSFQTDPGNILGYPVLLENGLWELKRTYEFAWREDWSVDYQIYRYKTIIDRAINSKTVCNFWFHPSFDERFCQHVLPEIFKYLDNKRNEILVNTVENYLDLIS